MNKASGHESHQCGKKKKEERRKRGTKSKRGEVLVEEKRSKGGEKKNERLNWEKKGSGSEWVMYSNPSYPNQLHTACSQWPCSYWISSRLFLFSGTPSFWKYIISTTPSWRHITLMHHYCDGWLMMRWCHTSPEQCLSLMKCWHDT